MLTTLVSSVHTIFFFVFILNVIASPTLDDHVISLKSQSEQKPLNYEETLLTAVLNGMSQKMRSLPSVYAYDEQGSKFFTDITMEPTYYLTSAEEDILRNRGSEIVSVLVNAIEKSSTQNHMNVIELGAGDGRKSKVIINKLLESGVPFVYTAIDVSRQALVDFGKTIENHFGSDHDVRFLDESNSEFESISVESSGDTVKTPVVRIRLIEGFDVPSLKFLASKSSTSVNLVVYLGSSVGNFPIDVSTEKMKSVYESINVGDFVLVGFDRMKDVRVMEKAYNNQPNINFMMHMMDRINKELGADFDTSGFERHSRYWPPLGGVQTFFLATRAQNVTIGSRAFRIKRGDGLHFDYHLKFLLEEIEEMAREAGPFAVVEHFEMKEDWFTDSLWVKRE